MNAQELIIGHLLPIAATAAYRSHRCGALVGVSLFVSQQQSPVFQPLFPADEHAAGLGHALARFALWN